MTEPVREGNSALSRLAAPLVTVSAVAALLILLGAGEMRFLLSRVWALGLGAAPGLAVVAAALTLGLALLPARTWRGCTPTEACLLAFGCGAAAVSCAMLALGIAGWTSPSVLRGLVVACVLAGAVRLVAVRGTGWAYGTGPDRETDPVQGTGIASSIGGWLLGAALFVALALLVTAAYAPPLLYDVTEYHMGALSDYAAAGAEAGLGSPRFVPLPWSMYARFPFPVESLYWFAALLVPPQDAGAKVVNAAFVIAGALLIGCWLRRAGVRPALRALAALAFLAHPLVLEVSIDAYIDAPSAFLVVSALYAMFLFEGLPRNPSESPGVHADDMAPPDPALRAAGILPVAGLLAGAALASKYTVAQLFLLPALLFFGVPLVRAVRRHRAWASLGVALVLGAVPLVFWLGKNVVFYGNPLEPFFVKWFRPGDAPAIAREQFYIASHYPQALWSASYWQRLPLRVGALGWAVLAPLAGIGLVMRRPGVLRLAGFVAVSVLLWNLVRESQNRFLLPSAMLVILLAAQVLEALASRAVRRFAAAAVAVASVSCLVPHALKLGMSGEFSWLAGYEPVPCGRFAPDDEGRRTGFLAANLGAIGEMAGFVNAALPPDAKVLLVYEARPYLFRQRTVHNTVFDASQLLRLARGARTSGEVAQRLRAAGITHVLVNLEELRRFIDQYSPPRELEAMGVTEPIRQFGRIATPEALYPPFRNDPAWGDLMQPVTGFLRDMRQKAIKVHGKPPCEVFLTPVE